ncbi:hypothetical protein KQI49_03380 [Virgibacillus sp. MSJ-26]|uniref:hypothetical protein n=1 Tax=Virgibacillus sp. MSJ-26 TaxID=2841522 RepID=UPI001C10A52C|nr:hypothetical protein [Virgibacillus sp. MSJ-26]MBU5465870.1 hypothetical protein [Virgibacillus sp. MSJ-26]
MSKDPLKNNHHLQKKLDEYHVNIPDFPMKPNRWERLINLLASPTRDPLEPFLSTSGGLLLLKLAPIMGAAIIAIIQMLIFL